MKLLSAIRRHVLGDFEPELLDHAPVSGTASYEQKLRAAAMKFGRPFKCSADGLPREVFKRDETGTYRYVAVDMPDATPTAPPVKPTLRIAK